MRKIKIGEVVSLIAAFFFGSYANAADQYPSKPIRLIIPYAPGGGVGQVGTVFMDELSAKIGQPIVSDYRGGGGATIGTYLATQANPDGHTMLFSLNALTINAAIRTNLKYDPIKDLAPVSLMLRSSSILVVHPSLGVKSLKELVSLANGSPKALTYGSQGQGTSAHMAMELLKHSTGMRLTHIPYTGGGPASTALLAGEVKTMILASSFGTPLIKSGKLTPIAVTPAQRISTFPDIPTFIEAGVPGADKTSYSGWWGILMPAATPKNAINKLSSELGKVVKSPKMVKLADERGFESVGSTPEEFGALLREDLRRWKEVAKYANVSAAN